MRDHLHPELQAAKYVVFVNSARHYTDCSPEIAKLVGYDRSELLDLKIDDLSFDNSSSIPNQFSIYQQQRQQAGEYILKHKDGSPVLIHYRAWVFDDGCHAAAWEPAEEWEQLYLAALLDLSGKHLRTKVNAALSAVQKRQSSLGHGDGVELSQKLQDAYEALRSILEP